MVMMIILMLAITVFIMIIIRFLVLILILAKYVAAMPFKISFGASHSFVLI